MILLIPDLIDRTALKELVNLLLVRMEFSSAFLHQESVCATFSAGLSSACVINVGGETTHICCVEEGMSNPSTRSGVRVYWSGSEFGSSLGEENGRRSKENGRGERERI